MDEEFSKEIDIMGKTTAEILDMKISMNKNLKLNGNYFQQIRPNGIKRYQRSKTRLSN
jgi:hypothetical protein